MRQVPDLRPQHRKVLRAVSELGYATYEQIARHGFSPASYTHVTEATNQLVAWGLVTYDFVKRGAEVGRSKRIFTCTGRGRAYCAREVPEEDLPITTKRHDVFFQEHRMGVGNLVIAARRFAQTDPERITVLRVQTDLVTTRRPVTVPLPDTAAKLIPDLWLELAVDGVRRSFAMEYDRGTERDTKGERQWREKVRKYVAGLRGPIQSYFMVPGCRIGVVVDPVRTEFAPRRLRTLLDWTEAELAALFARPEAQHQWGRLFRFAVATPGTCNPDALFTAPWCTPLRMTHHTYWQ